MCTEISHSTFVVVTTMQNVLEGSVKIDSLSACGIGRECSRSSK